MDGRARTAAREDAIAETRLAFVSALECGDAEAASRLYTTDATLLPPEADIVRGRDAIERFWRAGINSGLRRVELESLELARHERVAHEIGRYTLRLERSDGGIVIDRGKYLLVHERQEDGSWRRSAEMFNPDPLPPTQP